MPLFFTTYLGVFATLQHYISLLFDNDAHSHFELIGVLLFFFIGEADTPTEGILPVTTFTFFTTKYFVLA